MSAGAATGRYEKFLRGLLTPLRLEHSLGVRQVMGELAPVYSLDCEQAMIAGLLHDAARDLPAGRMLEMAESAGIPLDEPWDRHPIYLHGPVGALLVESALAVEDPLVLAAIAAHSFAASAPSFDSPFCWCLRFADVLAPSRPWVGVAKLGSVVRAGRMKEAALLQCGWLVEYLQEQGVPIHPNLERTLSGWQGELKLPAGFFERW